MRIACIGECMVELRQEPDGRMIRGFGGDTLNTAIYLARLGLDVDYVTALGDDALSDEMMVAWESEGVGTTLVLRSKGGMPGLYMIQTDSRGERRFLYWRDSAAARQLFNLPGTPALLDSLAEHDALYYSGISLSLYGVDGRKRLAEMLAQSRARGALIAFDTNFRPRGWPDRGIAQSAFRIALAEADLVFASAEDLQMLFGAEWEAELSLASPETEVILKLSDLTCSIRCAGREPVLVPTRPIKNAIDTTAAGDSFAAAYLAAKLNKLTPTEGAIAAHRLAGTVVAYPGAIIPRSAMPDGRQLLGGRHP